MKKIFAAATLATFIATPAFAADNSENFYGAIDLGTMNFGGVGDKGTPETKFAYPGAYSAGAGYHFSQMLALEVGYAMAGDSRIVYSTSLVTLRARSLRVAVVGTYPISSSVDLIGKLGIANNSISLTGAGTASTLDNTNSSSNLLVAIGAQYNFTNQFGMRVQYENLGTTAAKSNVSSTYSSDANLAFISFGAVYNF